MRKVTLKLENILNARNSYILSYYIGKYSVTFICSAINNFLMKKLYYTSLENYTPIAAK